MVTKYRKKLIYTDISKTLKNSIECISKRYNFGIDTMESDQDHIHLLIDISPSHKLSSIVSRLKAITTRELWKVYDYKLKYHFWEKQVFWSRGYFACSVGDASTETIRKYIDNQG